jgi:hypothetical protein
MNLPTSPDEEEADKFVAAAASVEAQMESIKVENESYWAEVASVTAENERRRAEVRSLREGRPHRALALTRARMAGDEVEAAALEAKIRAQDMKIQLARAEDTRSGVDATTTSLMEDIVAGDALLDLEKKKMADYAMFVRGVGDRDYAQRARDVEASIARKQAEGERLKATIKRAEEAAAENIAAAAAAEAAAAEAQRKVVLGRKGIAQNRLSKKALRKEKSIVEPRAAEAARQCAEEESQYNALKLALKNIYA